MCKVFFNLYIYDLIEKINNLQEELNINGNIINILAYADDIVLLSGTKPGLQKQLEILANWCVI